MFGMPFPSPFFPKILKNPKKKLTGKSSAFKKSRRNCCKSERNAATVCGSGCVATEIRRLISRRTLLYVSVWLVMAVDSLSLSLSPSFTKTHWERTQLNLRFCFPFLTSDRRRSH